MTLNHIAPYRLAAQQISNSKFTTAKGLVAHMGAIQAQDYSMAKWAVGIRLPGSTEREIEEAINKGEIIRTHVMRPTWHFVAADDLHWMLELAAPQIKRQLQARHKQLEIDAAVLKKTHKLLEKLLADDKHLSRKEINAAFTAANISINDNRASHLLMWAELDGIICSGVAKGAKTTYCLLQERVPKPASINRDEALAKLAERYFTAHGPATLPDFTWWSGLSVADAKKGLELIKPLLQSTEAASQTYWFTQLPEHRNNHRKTAHLLPAFDEYVISYRDRSAVLSAEGQKKTISKNGIFWPVILLNGQAVGLWKRTVKKDKLQVEIEYFSDSSSGVACNAATGTEKQQKALKKALSDYARFVGKEIIF